MDRNTVAVVPCPDYEPERVRAALGDAIEAALTAVISCFLSFESCIRVGFTFITAILEPPV